MVCTAGNSARGSWISKSSYSATNKEFEDKGGREMFLSNYWSWGEGCWKHSVSLVGIVLHFLPSNSLSEEFLWFNKYTPEGQLSNSRMVCDGNGAVGLASRPYDQNRGSLYSLHCGNTIYIYIYMAYEGDQSMRKKAYFEALFRLNTWTHIRDKPTE